MNEHYFHRARTYRKLEATKQVYSLIKNKAFIPIILIRHLSKRLLDPRAFWFN